MARKEYDINFLPYCNAMYHQHFQSAARELEQLVKECTAINAEEWWVKRENVPLAAARAYEAYIFGIEQLIETEYIEKVHFDEGQARIKKNRIVILDDS